jgi:voltage-gated potassium channel
VTAFTTAGFGAITAKSETARVVLIVQMLADLALLGTAYRLLLGPVRRGQQKIRAGGLGWSTPTGGPAISGFR